VRYLLGFGLGKHQLAISCYRGGYKVVREQCGKAFIQPIASAKPAGQLSGAASLCQLGLATQDRLDIDQHISA